MAQTPGESSPDKPWLWTADCGHGVISAHSQSSMWSTWGVCVLWNAVSSPLWFVIPKELREGHRNAILGLLFPVFGLCLFIFALRATLRWRKFGNVELRLSTLPGVIGGFLEGSARVPTHLQLQDKSKIEATLSCTKTTVTGTGKNQRTNTELLWQETQNITPETLSANETKVPIRFAIPYSCLPTDADAKIAWILALQAAVPGVDFAANFSVPVFKTEKSNPAFQENSLPQSAPLPLEAPSFPNSKILCTATDGDLTIHVPPVAIRKPGTVAGWFFFVSVWTGTIAGLIYANVPLMIPLTLGTFDLLFIAILADYSLRSTRTQISSGQALITNRFLFFSFQKTIPLPQVSKVDFAVTSSLTTPNKRTLYYSIFLHHTNNGLSKKSEIADSLSDKDEVRWLVAQIESALLQYS